MRIRFGISAAAIAALLSYATGCGDSGANTRPTVTVKKASDEGGSSQPASTGASKAGGNTGGSAKSGGSGPGTLKGVITLKGNAPGAKLLVRKGDPNAKDPAVCAAQNVPDESLVVGSDSGLGNVFIYLAKAPAGADVGEAPSEPIKFDQKFCQFIPHAMVVRAGQTVNVLNSDGVAHNTHTYPLNSEAFNKIVAPNEQDGIPMTYESPERIPVAVKCDIHPWMIAYQLPLDHPFAAVTDEEGNFEIANLPAGDHEFVIWHEKAGYLERKYKATVKAGETTEVNLSFGGEKLLAGPGDLKTINISALTR